MKAIFAVMNPTWTVVKLRPKKKFSTGFKPMTFAILVECSTNWELVIMLVPNKPVKWWINNCKYMNILYVYEEGFKESLTYDIDINVLNAKSKNIGLSNFYEKKNNKKMKPCLTKQLWDMFRLRCDSVRVCHATLQNGRIKVTSIQTQCSKTEIKPERQIQLFNWVDIVFLSRRFCLFLFLSINALKIVRLCIL